MTREPLMLSDTAMVLVRRLIELDNDNLAFREYQGSLRNTNVGPWPPPQPESLFLYRRVEDELFHEIRCLWLFPGLPLTRHLDWHILFDEQLMTAAEVVCVSSHSDERALALVMFIAKLIKKYQKTLALR
jgi:hypothetical protein